MPHLTGMTDNTLNLWSESGDHT